jgi:hypothetical protein
MNDATETVEPITMPVPVGHSNIASIFLFAIIRCTVLLIINKQSTTLAQRIHETVFSHSAMGP